MEPIGRSQVFLYLRRLALEHAITLITFEKASDWADVGRRNALKNEVAAAGIRWAPLRYHKTPTVAATAFDVGTAVFVGVYLTLRDRIEIVHARSYVPAIVALVLKRLLAVKFIFDMRGFWPDQKRDCGAWRQGSHVYRFAKWFESKFLKSADMVVSLTDAAVRVLRVRPEAVSQTFAVIPTCVDLDLFVGPRTVLKPVSEFVVGVVGSVTVSYLFDDMLRAFAQIQAIRSDAKLKVLNRDEHPFVWDRARRAGIDESQIEVRSVEHALMPGEMAGMDIAVFFLKPYPSLKAVAPTKLAELLASGVPCLCNAGIGDFDTILSAEGTGIVLSDLTPASLAKGAQEVVNLAGQPEVRRRCRESAQRRFSLEEGVRRYDAIYSSL
jgi:glycosyltransferase involved in cell wall biosynthesis